MVRAFLESLSLGSGAVLVAVLSAAIAWIVGHIRATALRWFAAILAPFALSYVCYWLPVWLGGSQDEHSAWEFLIVGVWFFAGVVASVVVTFIVRRHATRTI
jgi:hypothetical protein